MIGAGLVGRRVLVVEDEMLVSMLIEEVLADQQCVVVGPFERVAAALGAARAEVLDFAVLDVNVAGTKVYPVAEILSARGIPFLLLSGYGRSAAPREHPEWPVCSKPFHPGELVNLMSERLRDG